MCLSSNKLHSVYWNSWWFRKTHLQNIIDLYHLRIPMSQTFTVPFKFCDYLLCCDRKYIHLPVLALKARDTITHVLHAWNTYQGIWNWDRNFSSNDDNFSFIFSFFKKCFWKNSSYLFSFICIAQCLKSNSLQRNEFLFTFSCGTYVLGHELSSHTVLLNVSLLFINALTLIHFGFCW